MESKGWDAVFEALAAATFIICWLYLVRNQIQNLQGNDLYLGSLHIFDAVLHYVVRVGGMSRRSWTNPNNLWTLWTRPKRDLFSTNTCIMELSSLRLYLCCYIWVESDIMDAICLSPALERVVIEYLNRVVPIPLVHQDGIIIIVIFY